MGSGGLILSLVVPTMPGRENLLSRLLCGLGEQMCDDVEVLVLGGDGPMGDKVNLGFAQARGEWVAVVDDDDELASDFVDCIAAAVDTDPDMVGYRIASLRNGELAWMIEHHYGGDTLWATTRRGPCPKMPIRTQIACRHWFGNQYTADRVWSTAVAADLSSGVFVDRTLYRHDFWTIDRPDVGEWPFDASLFRWV